ncbi:MAG: DUF126 domain-containing protein [Steroidobacteraceae bacterium]
MRLEVLIAPHPPRTVRGRALHLGDPLSFWGGVSPADGRLTDPRSARFGTPVSGRVLLIRELRGSSSGSSVLLELAYRGLAPAAVIVGAPDAILALGSLVAAEMQWEAPGIYRLPLEDQERIPEEALLTIDAEGTVVCTP